MISGLEESDSGKVVLTSTGDEPRDDRPSSLAPRLRVVDPTGLDRPDLAVLSANSLRSASSSRSNLNKKGTVRVMSRF